MEIIIVKNKSGTFSTKFKKLSRGVTKVTHFMFTLSFLRI